MLGFGELKRAEGRKEGRKETLIGSGGVQRSSSPKQASAQEEGGVANPNPASPPFASISRALPYTPSSSPGVAQQAVKFEMLFAHF
jgi:hypothetical protein